MPKRPSAWWYLLAILLPIGGCIGSASMAFSRLGNLDEKLAELPHAAVGPELGVTLEKGGHLVFFETAGGEGKSFETVAHEVGGEPSPVDCSLRDSEGAAVDLRAPSGSTRYTLDGRSGRAVAEVTVTRPGLHLLSCAYTEPGKALASGDNRVIFVGGSLFAGVATIFAPALLGFAAAITLALAVFFKRRRSEG